jgi:hypothetical protein
MSDAHDLIAQLREYADDAVAINIDGRAGQSRIRRAGLEKTGVQ